MARRHPIASVEARLFKHVEKTAACWLWTGYCDRAGYGTIQVSKYPVLVHRLSYILHNGTIPAGRIVRHTCDVRNCVRPDHLVPGTALDNSGDMVRRGRAAVGLKNSSHRYPERRPRGEAHGNAVLSDEQVREVRTLYTGRRGQVTALAALFGVSLTNISQIVRGLTRRDA